jgi:hypothetical protein
LVFDRQVLDAEHWISEIWRQNLSKLITDIDIIYLWLKCNSGESIDLGVAVED